MADQLDDWNKGDDLTAAHFQQPVTALRRQLATPNAQAQPFVANRNGFRFVVTLGQIVDHGPNGEADKTNEQYWVKPQYIQGEVQRDDPITLNEITPPDEYLDDDTSDGDRNIVAVTNLPELLNGRHTLQTAQYVWFFLVADGQDDPVEHPVMSEYGIPPALIPVLVSQVGGANGTQTTAATWTYDVTDVSSNAIASALSPTWARAVGKKVAASHGNGYYDPSGNFVLEQVDEVDDTGECD